MKIDQNKSSVGKRETKRDGTLCEPARFTKGMAKNLTMLDTIGLVALIMFQLGLSQCMLIGLDNLKEKDDKEDNA